MTIENVPTYVHHSGVNIVMEGTATKFTREKP